MRLSQFSSENEEDAFYNVFQFTGAYIYTIIRSLSDDILQEQ